MNQRRGFFRKLGGVAGMLAFSGAADRAAAADLQDNATPGGLGGKFVHTVLFWLVDETMPTRGQFVTEVMKYLKEIDVIRTRHLGRPAGTDREVVDNSYSYCMIVTFDSKEDHDIYQEHEAHRQFVANASSLWNRVQVYDSIRCEM